MERRKIVLRFNRIRNRKITDLRKDNTVKTIHWTRVFNPYKKFREARSSSPFGLMNRFDRRAKY